MVFCAETNGFAYTAEELLQLNRNYWDKIHTLDIEYYEEHSNDGKLLFCVPSSRWVLTPERERLQTHGWHYLLEELQVNSNSDCRNTNGIEIYDVDFLRRTDEYYLLLRGSHPKMNSPKSFNEADELGLLAAKVDDIVFDSGSFESFS